MIDLTTPVKCTVDKVTDGKHGGPYIVARTMHPVYAKRGSITIDVKFWKDVIPADSPELLGAEIAVFGIWGKVRGLRATNARLWDYKADVEDCEYLKEVEYDKEKKFGKKVE